MNQETEPTFLQALRRLVYLSCAFVLIFVVLVILAFYILAVLSIH